MDKFMQQIRLPFIGVSGQSQLAKTHVLIFGAGGLTASCLPYLVHAGIGQVTLVDHDTVSLSNLHRQILFRRQDIGAKKVDVLAQWVRVAAPECGINTIADRVYGVALIDLFLQADIVVDGTDDLSYSWLINQVACVTKTPVVYGNAIGMQGQLMAFSGHKHDACLCCLWGESPNVFGPTCSSVGVLGPVPGMIGTLMATQTIKIALQSQVDPVVWHQWNIYNRLNNFSADTMQWKNYDIHVDSDCEHHAKDEHSVRTVLHRNEQAIYQGSLHQAVRDGFKIIDICEPTERSEPLSLPHMRLPMAQLLQDPHQYLVPGTMYLLVCKTGRRSRWCAEVINESVQQLWALAWLGGGDDNSTEFFKNDKSC